MATVRTGKFRSAAVRSLSNRRLRAVMERGLGERAKAQTVAVEELTAESWEELRRRAQHILDEALTHLDYYLELLDRNVRANGGHVHYARTAQEANAIVLAIAKASGAAKAVKSTSLVAEETSLVSVLAQHGVEAVETDLERFIIQLAGEPPFHMTAPALHKSREEVAVLFQRHLGAPVPADPAELAQVARRALRERFAAADIGITGASFLVAETGTVILVSNEGNARMTSSLPRVHVAVAGMEKVVPAVEDLAVLLPVLARSATGQILDSHITFVSGPRAPSEEDGPGEFHLVVLDNGRSRLLGDPELREALRCIGCGACSNVCPVYREIGGHAYGWVYSGPIGAVLSPMLTGLKEGRELAFASTLCGACREACPVNIDMPRLLAVLRRRSAEGHPQTERSLSWFDRLAERHWFDAVTVRSNIRRSPALSRLAQLVLFGGEAQRRAPAPVFKGWRQAGYPPPATRPFRDLWREQLAGRR